MARGRSRNDVGFPFSGDVVQAINPWRWWLESTGQQVGFINIFEMESSNSERELEIIEEVASYGKQLGRIIETLSVVLRHPQFANLGSEEERAKKDFLEMADEIAAVKGGYAASTDETTDRFLAGLRHLERRDPGAYEALRGRLLEQLGAQPDKE